jgi:hypothetical protein
VRSFFGDRVWTWLEIKGRWPKLTSFDQLPHCLLESHQFSFLYYNSFYFWRLSHGSAPTHLITQLQFEAIPMYCNGDLDRNICPIWYSLAPLPLATLRLLVVDLAQTPAVQQGRSLWPYEAPSRIPRQLDLIALLWYYHETA